MPHDAREPAQFVFSDGAVRLGLLTDAGSLTAHMQAVLSGLDALVLECNHDLDAVEQRCLSADASSSALPANSAISTMRPAARCLRGIDCSRLKHLIAAHLRQQNNTPELASAALAGRSIASRTGSASPTQADGFDWLGSESR